MRTLDENFLDSITGTTVGDRLLATVWRDETPPALLDVTAWTLSWDAGRTVQGMGTLTVADQHGLLAPWGLSDLLGPGGSRVRLAWFSGLTRQQVPLGVWRIRESTPTAQWRVYGGSSLQRVYSGGSVVVRIEEVTSSAVLQRLDAVPGPTKATALAEIAHLLDGIMPVTAPGITDVPAPQIAYRDDRMDAVLGMLNALDAVHRVAPDGSLEVLRPSTTPQWTIQGGDDGVLIDASWTLSDEGVYNAVVSTGQTPEGAPLVGRAYIPAGPMRWGGPFGKVPMFHEAVATTESGVQADANTMLTSEVQHSELVMPVECLTNPALQPYDTVQVVAASAEGDTPLIGRVRSMSMFSASTEDGIVPSKRMTLGVAVPAQALEAAARRIGERRG